MYKTVKELKEILKDYSDDTIILRDDCDYATVPVDLICDEMYFDETENKKYPGIIFS